MVGYPDLLVGDNNYSGGVSFVCRNIDSFGFSGFEGLLGFLLWAILFLKNMLELLMKNLLKIYIKCHYDGNNQKPMLMKEISCRYVF